MPRAGLSPEAVVDAAVAVVDAGGPGALTLAAVAGRAGVATSCTSMSVISPSCDTW